MTILSIKLNNFGPYFGEKQFTFSKGINIITGGRDTGKTQLMSAVAWVVTDQIRNENIYGHMPIDVIVSKKAIGLSNGNPVEVSVEIILEDEEREKRYLIKRSFCFRDKKNANKSTLIIKETDKCLLTISHSDREIQDRILINLFPPSLRNALWLRADNRNISQILENFFNNSTSDKFVRIESYLHDLSRSYALELRHLIHQHNNRIIDEKLQSEWENTWLKELELKNKTITNLFEIAKSTKIRMVEQIKKIIEKEANRHLSELVKYLNFPSVRIGISHNENGYMANFYYKDGSIVEKTPHTLMGIPLSLSVKLAVGTEIFFKRKIGFCPMIDDDYDIQELGDHRIMGFINCLLNSFEQSIFFYDNMQPDTDLYIGYKENQDIVKGKFYQLSNTDAFNQEFCETLIQEIE